MPEVHPFRAWRYNLAQVGSLSDVVAPPYDVIDPALQNDLYKKHPCNVIRLILNRAEPGDGGAADRYARAARFLRQWKNQDVFVEDGHPALYVYHQTFDSEGRTHTRRGFMARVRLEPFGTGNVFAHEETMPGPKADRLQLMEATAANLSPIFGLYPDPERRAQRALDGVVQTQTPLEATDHLGVIHRFWPVTQPGVLAEVSAAMAALPVFIADGHHRYETACLYRQRKAENASLPQLPHDDPANFVLMMLVAMDDPGLLILPTHRLFSGLSTLTASDLQQAMAGGTGRPTDDFEWTARGQGHDGLAAAWEFMQADGDPSLLAFGTGADAAWQLARLRHPQRMDELAPEHSPAWRALGVSILQRLVLRRLPSDLNVQYVHTLAEVETALLGSPPSCQLACLVQPASLEDLRTIASGLEKMPPKSTYFYPKLLSGLVINPLR